MYKIRPYNPSDFAMLSDWWRAHSEPAPLAGMVPPTSWVLESEAGIPILSVSIIETNIPAYCLVDNFIGNPEMKGPERAMGSRYLLEYIEQFARSRGYERLFCLSYKPALKSLYEDFGFCRTLDDVSTFIKPLR